LPTSFAPIVDDETRVLVLGSMPGALSLRMRQYYAHPQNAFWRITAALVGFDKDAEYQRRLDFLRHAGIGLWDVLHSCDRDGSMDAAIVRDTMAANDFRGLFTRFPNISRVFFNGAKAEEVFNRLVDPSVAHGRVTCRRLPSTSPANAVIPFEAKLHAWRAIVDDL
jgi:double-stranded uracil-DNA glycosylase